MCWRNQAQSVWMNFHTCSLGERTWKKDVYKCSPGPRGTTVVSLPSPLMGGGSLLCVDMCLFPDIQADRSDCGPDGPWCGWLDQVERYQTTHSGWHKLWGLSVLGGRGSTGTMETLRSNKLIRRETDTPVRYRVTETEGNKREGDKEDRIRSGLWRAQTERRR